MAFGFDATLTGFDAALAVARFHLDPLRCGSRLRRRHGGAVVIAPPWRARGAGPPVIVLLTAEGARGAFDVWDDLRPTGLWPVRAPQRTIHERLRFNFLCLAGDAHRHYSRQVADPLRRDVAERSFPRQRALIARELAAFGGPAIDLRETTRRIATICVFDALFGETDAERAMRIGTLLNDYHELNWSLAAIALPARIPGAPYARVLRTAEAVHREVGIWMERGAGGGSIRSALAGLRDPDGGPAARDFAVASLCTIAWAAFDTPWLALFWALVALAARPELQERLRAEMRAIGAPGDAPIAALARAPLLNGVIYEALRLYPPAPYIGLRAVRVTAIGGAPVPEGATLFLNIHEIHRDPALYPDPGVFRPERWPPGKAPGAHALLSFSGGARRCPGYAYSMMFLRLALSEICGRFALDRAGARAPRRRVAPTLAPIGPAPCRIRPAPRRGPLRAA